MKKELYYILLLSLAILSAGKSFGQKKDSTWVGTLHGVVLDSAHNSVLRAATVAIYTVKDAALMGYTLTNNYGEFSYKGLPTAIPLKIIASFVGYKSTEKEFLISSVKSQLDIGHINLIFSSNELQEVKITYTPPPVVMKGDTLEFNADAFKLDPNAQTEDLLRVLPGITVWADGTITVNGREVKSVLVNGKPFFGGDARVATQNIPKNVVDKIQVYQKDKNPEKPADSTTEINIKLKKGKDVGYFGKFSGGYGTGGHYESDGNLNFFNRNSQLGLAISSNNVDKTANDINFILRNNTFKGTGAGVEYQSNFNIDGINKYTAGGLLFQHDFIPNPDFSNNNRLTALYFIKNNHQDLEQNTQTVTTLNDGSFYTQQNKNKNTNVLQSQSATTSYEKINDGNKFSIDGSFKNEVSHSMIENESLIIDQNNNQLSTNHLFNQLDNTINEFGLKTSFKHKPINQGLSWLSGYELNYKLNLSDFKTNQDYRSAYSVATNEGEKVNLNRFYNNNSTLLLNNFLFKLPNAGALIFGGYKFAGIVTGLQNEIEITNNNLHSIVKDKDTLTNEYQNNSYLTNNRQETTYNIKPSLTFTKNVYKSLSSRYEKIFSVTANIIDQLYTLNSASEKTFQQFSKSYQKFVPNANISYSNRQFGEFTNTVSLQITTSSQYPTVQQLTPLVDSANLNYIQKGNSSLKEQNTRELTINFRHLSEKSTNILTWSVSLNAGYIQNYFAGSSNIDNLGRTLYTTVNADGYRYLNGTADIKKAFKFNDSQLQFSISPMASINRSPGYINGILDVFNNFSLSYNPGINYTYKNWLAINIDEKQSLNNYSQKGTNSNKLSNSVSQSEISFSISCTKRLSLSSNAIYTKNTYNGVLAKNFTIWNAAANYKMFKGNIAELKLSGLDLLHQNTGLINYGFNNSITQGSVNVLQQYFMLTFAYFPRKFGK